MTKRAISVAAIVVMLTMFNEIGPISFTIERHSFNINNFLHRSAIQDFTFVHNFYLITIDFLRPRSMQFSPSIPASRTQLQLLPSRMPVPFPSCQSSCRLAVTFISICTTNDILRICMWKDRKANIYKGPTAKLVR